MGEQDDLKHLGIHVGAQPEVFRLAEQLRQIDERY